MTQTPTPPTSRRDALTLATGLVAALGTMAAAPARGQPAPAAQPTHGHASAAAGSMGDGVWICCEDSNTLVVIDPVRLVVQTSVNLTSFDEDRRPPFRFVTGGFMPTHGAMVQKPLYHGAISIHGAVPNPDSTLVATTGRGTSNLYLIDTATRRIIGNRPNPQASAQTNPDRLTSGVFVGREPHEPTFTRNGRELWVTVRGEDRIAVLDVQKAREESAGGPPGHAIRGFVDTMPGPAHAWFSADGSRAVVISQKASLIDLLDVTYDASGFSTARRSARLDVNAQDRFGFSPFLKLSPDGREFWISHKLADSLSVLPADGRAIAETIPLGALARPNHVEFVENAQGRAVYASLGRIDDGAGPGGGASSKLAIIDRSAPLGQRRVVGEIATGGREAHGLWLDPAGTRLFVVHEQDELPGTPGAGQTLCTVLDVTDPFRPRFVDRVMLGDLALPSGGLRNKKGINLVFIRPGARSVTA
ncbi:YncE family protein [Falsiroseomonas selenitidurans]|uniref:YncE family protein n=1 Tax=Falsiroseomonas selenitidurans TaxID=2716335 RepID=UPI001ADDE8C1|nr:beta-propeller fold lactonase family protein [Falsiroseomonas selenitidurans]